jgi:hypothetical protein
MPKHVTGTRYRLEFELLPPQEDEAPVIIRLRWLLKWALRDLRLRCKSVEELPRPPEGDPRPEGVLE